MPTFDTPEPISATVDVLVADVRVSAGERSTTDVEVRPRDPANPEDVKAAEQTEVVFAGAQLVVKTPRRRSFRPWGGVGAIDVAIELPAGSRVQGSAQAGDFRCDGRIGDCRIRTGLGRVQLDQVGTASVKSASGDLTVDLATGHADLVSGSGDIRVREIDGSAVIKNSNGDTWVGLAAGEVRLNSANGNIAVDEARAGLGAKTANGDVRVGAVERGSVVLETSRGDLEIGIREGSAAWLDVSSTIGRIHNALESASGPDPSAQTVEVRARTTVGDIVIRRP